MESAVDPRPAKRGKISAGAAGRAVLCNTLNCSWAAGNILVMKFMINGIGARQDFPDFSALGWGRCLLV